MAHMLMTMRQPGSGGGMGGVWVEVGNTDGGGGRGDGKYMFLNIIISCQSCNSNM